MWTVAVSGKKKLQIRKYPDTCGWGTSKKRLRGHSWIVACFALQQNATFDLLLLESLNICSGSLSVRHAMLLSHLIIITSNSFL